MVINLFFPGMVQQHHEHWYLAQKLEQLDEKNGSHRRRRDQKTTMELTSILGG